MPSYDTPIKNSAFIMYLGLPSQANSKTFQTNPTLAAGDFQVSKDGGALANLTTLPTVTPAAGKMVKVSLSATEMNADNVTVVASDAAGSEWCDTIVNIQTTVLQNDSLPDAIWDVANGIETGYTPRQTMRLLLAAEAGKVSISGSTVTIRNATDAKNRITATTDTNGQRTAVTLDAT